MIRRNLQRNTLSKIVQKHFQSLKDVWCSVKLIRDRKDCGHIFILFTWL